MRDVQTTYWRLVETFKQKPSGTEKHHVWPSWLGTGSEEVVFVSQKHHACLHYLIWLGEQTREAASAFTAAATSWQRTPGPWDQYVVSYQLIQRVGAWSTLSMKRPKNPDWTKAQYDHPFYEMRRKRGLVTVQKQLETGSPAAAKKWKVTNPLNETFFVYNLAQVLRDLGLSKTQLVRQGYTLEKQ